MKEPLELQKLHYSIISRSDYCLTERSTQRWDYIAHSSYSYLPQVSEMSGRGCGDPPPCCCKPWQSTSRCWRGAGRAGCRGCGSRWSLGCAFPQDLGCLVGGCAPSSSTPARVPQLVNHQLKARCVAVIWVKNYSAILKLLSSLVYCKQSRPSGSHPRRFDGISLLVTLY